MNGRSRICGVLDDELSRHLSFTFVVTENMTRPRSPVLRPADRFRFTVWAINRSDIGLTWLRGDISPTGSATFTPVPFSIARLAPGQRLRIATIEARALKKPGVRFVRLDTIGSVQVSISPDLSDLRLKKIKQLTFVQSQLTPFSRDDRDRDSVAS